MNEFGSTYLDMDDDDDYIDQKIQIPEPETTQKITQSTDDTNAESHLTTSDSPVSAQEEEEQEEEDQNKNVGGSGAGFQEETHEIPVVPNQQGGSPSSSWLGSSVTGWLGLGKEDQPDSVAEGEIEDKREDTQSETLTSSVTGWLGFGGNGKPDNGKESVKVKEETAESLTSTMTGWLSFGGGSKSETEEEQEADEDKEPTEKFRSRRMSLDLEGSQLQEEEKKEMGTLGWLGNGLSSTLGFGLTSQESGQEKEEKVQANSWLNMEIEGILGFRKDKVGDNENKESESKEAEIITTLEQPTGSQNVDHSESEEEIIKTSNNSKEVEELSEDQNTPSTEPLNGQSVDSNTDISDSGINSDFDEEAEPTVDNKDISPERKFEEESQALVESPPSKDDDDNIEKSKINEERSEEREGEDAVIHKPIGNEHMDNSRESGEEERKTPSAISQDSTPPSETPSESILGPDHVSVDLKSTSMLVKEDEKDQMENKKSESVEEEGAEITNQTDNTEEPTEMSLKITRGDDNKGEVSNEDTDLPETQTEELNGDVEDSSTESQPHLLSSMEKNDPVPAENESFTPCSAETNNDNSDTVALFDNNTEAETVHGELEQEGETLSSQEFDSQHNPGRSTQTIPKDRGTSAPTTDQTSVSPVMEHVNNESDSDAGKLKEIVEDNINESQQVKTEIEASGTKEDDLNENDFKSAISSELEAEKEEESKDGGNQGVMKVEDNEELEDLKEIKEQKGDEKESNEAEVESMQGEVEDLKEANKQLNAEEEKHPKVEELVEEEELVGLEGKEKKEGEGKKVKEQKEDEEEKESNEAEVESMQGEMGELKEDRKQLQKEELPEKEKEAKVEMLQREEELEGVQEKEKKDEEGKTVQSSYYEAKIPSTTNTQNGSGSSFTEIVAQVESHQDVEGRNGEDGEKKQAKAEELKFEETDRAEVEEVHQEENEVDDSFKCSNELCPQVHEEKAGSGLEEGGEGAIQTEKLKDQANTPGERQMIDSDEETANNTSEEAESTHALGQGDKTESGDTESSSKATQQLNSDQQTHTEKAAVVVEDKDTDIKMRENDSNGSESWHEGGREPSAPHSDPAKSQSVTSEQTAPSLTDDVSPHPPTDQSGETETESKTSGAFGLLKNPFGVFSQKSTTESDGSAEPAQSFSTSPGEALHSQDSLTPEQEPDSTTHHLEVVHKDSPTITEQPQLHPSSAEMTRTLSKHYKNLLTHMGADETAISLELFGRHKLQFLDYILSNSDTMLYKPDEEDESILSDVERLLYHHKETLIAPSVTLTDALQEDKEKTRMLMALQKLETLLGRVRQTFNTRQTNDRNHQGSFSQHCLLLASSWPALMRFNSVFQIQAWF